MPKLDTVPHEILERIAFISATESLLGPPSTLATLLGANRHIYACLSFASNHYLYARIFSSKFDVGPSSRRFIDHSSPTILAHELIHRFRVLNRIRARIDSGARPGSAGDGDSVHELLFHAYLMMLENAGKNEQQLRDYAKMGEWLRDYLFEEHFSARPRLTTHVEHWPPHNEHTSLAMWLFWFLLRPDDYTMDDDSTWNVLNVLKIYALGAHKYPLTDPSWVNFLPESPQPSTHIVHYSEAHQLKTPPLATPAILSFLTLVNLKAKLIDLSQSHLDIPLKAESNEWEYELGRCLSLSRPEFDNGLTESFRPGSVEGTWEGIFTYTEFTAYAALLQGAPPPILQKSVIVRHRQTWKLREHHFVVSTRSVPVDAAAVDSHGHPLSAGDPLRAYFPTGTHIIETRDGLEVRDPNRPTELRYYRSTMGSNVSSTNDKHNGNGQTQVQDIIITGEGHSAWGQFNLVGRVRPCDGFISLCKEYVRASLRFPLHNSLPSHSKHFLDTYSFASFSTNQVDHDRGKWIYRGYLVGNINGNLAGRWRDTLSPAAVPGYEGCFLMTRRR
ncbi:hypothetical protein MVEN_00314200 [Mycena venus]|uniref:F-box domain-containing protein n=1 Tax=Mycena venus TaxID=2733690 RepID=A0A8H6Z5U5_9AGAR|nr:hypothetical protein MVEN_00314200 [Mycena venus]